MATVNVTSFGAVGNGSTDDTTACQNACNALSSGDTLLFPAGTFIVDVLTISSKNNITVTGVDSSWSSKVKRPTTATNAPLFTVSGGTGITFTLLELNGQGPSQSWWDPNAYTADGTVFGNNIQITGGSGHSINSVYTHLAGSAGVRFYGVTNSTITSCIGDNNGFGTIASYNNGATRSSGVTVTSCQASQDYCDGIRLVKTDSSTVSDCISHDARVVSGPPALYAGFYVEDSDGVTIQNCLAYNNSAKGVDFAPGATNGMVVGCYCYGNANAGILAHQQPGFIASRNRCYNNGGYGLETQGHDSFFYDNSCHDQGVGAGGGGSNHTFVNNDFRGNSLFPIIPGSGTVQVNTIIDSDVFQGGYKNNGGLFLAMII